MTSLNIYGLLSGLLIGFLLIMPAKGQQIKIVGHQEGPPDELSLNEARSIFKAQQQWWKSNTKISIVLLKSEVPISGAVAEKIFGMSKSEVKTYWIQIVFRGKASTPKHFDSESALIAYIAQTPGAVGVVSAEADVGELKVIEVDGNQIW